MLVCYVKMCLTANVQGYALTQVETFIELACVMCSTAKSYLVVITLVKHFTEWTQYFVMEIIFEIAYM